MSEHDRRKDLHWLEVRLRVDGELAEAVSEYLGRLGTGGAVLEEIVPGQTTDDVPSEYWVKVYMPAHSPEDERLHRRRVEEDLWHLSQIHPLNEPEFKLLADEDWAEVWKASYHPFLVGKQTVIKPSWCEWEADEGQIVIELDPGMAFGTGLHPSTQLCLIGLEDHALAGQQVLDLGTGSGILAIAAALSDVKQVLALDIDPLAVESAISNAELNEVADRIHVATGSLPPRDHADQDIVRRAEKMAPAGFGLMLVNILAEVIVDLLERGLCDWLAPDGVMIAAGIIRERQEMVHEALAAAGLAIVDCRTQGDWVAQIARKSSIR